MQVTYVDGPLKGDVVDTTALTVHAVYTHAVDGCLYHEALVYRVDPQTRTARLVTPPDLRLVRDATPDELLTELRARGWRPWLITPMRRNRRDMPALRPGWGR